MAGIMSGSRLRNVLVRSQECGRVYFSTCPLKAVRAALRKKPVCTVSDDLFVACSRATAVDRKRMFLGLDISSRFVGYSVLDDTGKCVTCDVIPLSNISHMGDAGIEINKFFSHLVPNLDEYDWVITAEDCLRTANRGFYNSRGLIKLAQCNAVTQFACRQVFGVNPWLVHPTSPRAFFNFNFKRHQEGTVKQTVKERALHWVKD